MNTISIIILAVFIGLQGLDTYTTWKLFQRPGTIENNKIMAWLIEKIGVLPALVSFKIVVTAVLLFALWKYPYWQVQAMALGVCAAYLWAVINNWKQI